MARHRVATHSFSSTVLDNIIVLKANPCIIFCIGNRKQLRKTAWSPQKCANKIEKQQQNSLPHDAIHTGDNELPSWLEIGYWSVGSLLHCKKWFLYGNAWHCIPSHLQNSLSNILKKYNHHGHLLPSHTGLVRNCNHVCDHISTKLFIAQHIFSYFLHCDIRIYICSKFI